MKFLKTFLFTISLIFLSFGFVSLKGFCASVALDPALSPSVNSNINQFSTFAITPEYMSIYGPAYIDELNSQLYSNYGWDLETLSWYGEDRFKGYMFGTESNPLNSTDLTPVVANAIANRMMTGTLETIVTAKNLYDTGYNYFSTAVPQWGENAKQWILGKIDSVTGKITEVGSNTVTKITSQGLSNYLSLYNNTLNNGSSVLYDEYKPIYSDSFNLPYTSPDVKVLNLELPFNCFVYQWDSGNNYNDTENLKVCYPASYSDNQSNYGVSNINGYIINNSGSYENVDYIYLDNIGTFTLNGERYAYGALRIHAVNSGYIAIQLSKTVINLYDSRYYEDNVLSNYISSLNPSICLSYDYSSSWQSALQGQLDRLIGKYVDSIALKRIQDIVDSIPIGVENVGGVDVPVALPTQSIVDELTSAVDDAVALDPDYALVFEDADAVVLDPDVPLPTPSNQGTAVPEDFPETIFSPITDSVDGMFDIVSIFEPLFYIFSFSAGLLSLWLIVPFVILFLILFRLLK